MTESRWRHFANHTIARVIGENPGVFGDDLRKKLSEAYPFGERKMHPYKIWLDAVKKALDPTRKKPTTSFREEDCNGQELLFDEDAI